MNPLVSAGTVLEPPRPSRQLHLPLLMLSQYLFFLTRRPVSKSNFSYLEARLRGLKSLWSALDAENMPGLPEVVRQLKTLHPAGFSRVGNNLGFALLPLAQAARFLPEDLVVDDTPPEAGWVCKHRRALLVFGPGIGVGDELIVALLPKCLKQQNPGLEITTLSGYGEIWDRARHVDQARVYRDFRQLLAALRGEAPYVGFDLVILADFEAPELYRGVASDGRVPSYLEISLGSRSAFLLDNRRRWLHRVHHFTPYAENYYFGLNQVLRRLGLRPETSDRFSDVMHTVDRRPRDRIGVFVSPFTSKYDPSHGYWSRILAEIGGGQHPRPLRMRLDSGKNLSTESFAESLARSVDARVAANVEVEVARGADGGSLSLGGVFEELEAAHAVVCADSFAAHAAPLFGCRALVVARSGLENWQVPAQGSFYFDGDAPSEELGARMRELIRGSETPLSAAERLVRFSQAEVRLEELARELEALLEDGAQQELALLRDLYTQFADLSAALANVNEGKPASNTGPFGERPPPPPSRRPSAPDFEREESAGAMLDHLRDQLERWRNTNYFKYLQTCLAEQASNGKGGL